MARNRVANVMEHPVTCVREDMSVAAVTALLLDGALHGAPVVDGDGRLVGYVAMTDLLRSFYEAGDTDEDVPLERHTHGMVYRLGRGFHAEHMTTAMVGDVMTAAPVEVRAGSPVARAAALLASKRLQRAPVVDDDGHVVGMLSAVDALRFLLDHPAPAAKASSKPAPRPRRPTH